MFEFPVFKAFVAHDLVMGIPRKVFLTVWIVGIYVVMASGAWFFLGICACLHYACYILTKYLDVNFVEIFMIYFASGDRRE